MATFKDALEYAANNPNSDFAKQFGAEVATGNHDAEAQQLGYDTTPIKQKYAPQVASQVTPQPQGILSKIGNALTGSEQAVGKDLTAGIRAKMETKNEDLLRNSQTNTENILQAHINALKASGQDSAHAEKTLAGIKANSIAPQSGDFQNAVPESTKTNLQGLGDVAGVGADVLSAGSYGNLAKGAETGKLLTKGGGLIDSLATKVGIPTSEKVASTVANTGIKQTLGQTTKTIAKQTGVRSLVGGGIGYGYDVIGNLQQGKTVSTGALKPGVGTAVGVGLPLAIGGIREGMAISKSTAPKFINSLVKPKTADFSYGRNPGRTVSELGITGNNMDDFANNISTARKDIGSQIGAIYDSKGNAGIRIDATPDIQKLDTAIQEAAKGGKNNQAIVSQLQNVKDSLLYDHAINADGVIEKVGTTPRDLTSLNPQEAFNLKDTVANATQFTGRTSDDKKVNATLKSIYGGLKDKLNSSVGINNPELKKLNQQYADLTSAEIATRNRASIVSRADMIGMPLKVGGSVGLITAIGTGGAAIPVILAGVGATALDKALSSTAVKTRIASWLAKESPNVIQTFLSKNPEIAPLLRRSFPIISSKISKN